MKRIVVVGGSLAGVNALEEIRERGFSGDLVLVGAEPRLPYTRPPLSKEALADGINYEQLALRPPGWYTEHGVTLRLGHAASGLDPRGRVVVLDDGTTIAYDGLVIATGSSSRRSALTAGITRAHELRGVDDAERLFRALRNSSHLVVIGAGFIGLEAAATARGLGLDVTVVDIAASPMHRAFGPEVGDWFRRRHEERGVRILCATGVAQIEEQGPRTLVRLADGETLAADALLVAVGAAPATSWLTGSLVSVGDGILCEPDLATSVPDVVAAGDVARWHNRTFDESMRVEHWTNAVEQGRHAAATLLGERRPFESVPFFWTDQFNAKLRCVGRPGAADDVEILTENDTTLVAVYGRRGLLSGAVCVNAPRQLATLRQAVAARTPFAEVAGSGLVPS
ncbi:NAD(P)/FAD-dependent oxidoreductase [Streptomyces sp. ME19-01-6]|uniref:NAD(P)/FAD-dependent oxidoreductase n=1 Tax=Streptomyces sp. ME19-01-6 TaxID=3028686 RepID=UPI0029AD1CBF|nr:FAD-dependent oxidoreductase [Streptomyces sp. ME19-01-6]MDX3233847.1 FAD-dependent oxidoreductase [Streptomyces sp. ME19-01-6]